MRWIKAFITTLAVALPLTASALADETSVQAPSPERPLAGSLLTTARNAAVVIIIPGCGPTDRNGNNRQSGLTPVPIWCCWSTPTMCSSTYPQLIGRLT